MQGPTTIRVVLAIGLALGCGSCLGRASFPCATDSDCQNGATQGVCQSVGYCSFADSTCSGGQRFGDLSGPFAGQCIGGGSGGDGGVDAAACSASCPLGCDTTNTRCLQLVPSNGIDPAWVGMGTGPLTATADVVIDTDAGTITPPVAGFAYHQVAPIDCGGGALVGIGAFSFTSITIAEGVRVRAVGTRALALLAAGAVEIDGVLDVSGGAATPTCNDPPRCAGAGSFDGGLYDALAPQIGFGPGGGGHGFSNNGPGNESGGGGGGGCGNGGAGGDDGSGMFVAGAGGTGYLAASLVPLCGGSGGGAGGPASFVGDPGSRGGGGGGAVQIVSTTSVTIGSTNSGLPSGITAGGGGGQGDKAATIDDGAGGGGAGGAILIEAPTIAIAADAIVAANGGGGGGGFNNGALSTDGTPGLLATTPAAGGPGVRRGGNGAAGATAAGENAPGPVGDGGAGGGGGSGRIRLDALTFSVVGGLSPSGACQTQGTLTTR